MEEPITAEQLWERQDKEAKARQNLILMDAELLMDAAKLMDYITVRRMAKLILNITAEA